MLIQTIKTRPMLPPADDLLAVLRESFKNFRLKEKSIIVIASKVVSIGQGRCVEIDTIASKDDLIKKEADFYLDRSAWPRDYAMLTMKNNILIPTAGIDESNGNGYYILWPAEPFGAARKIYNFVQKNYHLKDFGVIIADSHCTPTRRGTLGIAIAYYGFYPLKDYRGTADIFGRKMKISLANIADALAAAAVLAMGEGSEQTPIAVVCNLNFVQFKKFDPSHSNPLTIGRDNDIYASLLGAVKWRKGGK